ncbi:hypothetical protein POM88_012921 [Heracleum sosnowskyi]|uniref:DUF4218 domain-containing protein n=1 Tax=Heracleum sosnowskyi TaxID=360622 RepID=A0AAD8J175_9APIA|nr:hypothetical protein POM88_012921 [Heracleum sosnowskyi]
MCEVSRLGSEEDMDCEAGIGFGDTLGGMLHHTHRMQNGETEHPNVRNAKANRFNRHIEDGKQPLYPGCLKFSRLSFILRLYSLKCVHGITEVLHPVKSSDGQYLEIRAAIFDMTNKEKEIFCSVLEKAKLPYGCAANISRYVHLRSKPEGSIAEGYLAEECLTFCSRFLNSDVVPKFERCPQKVEYPIGTRRNKDGKPVHLTKSQWIACHRYILFNCGNKDVENLIEEHRTLIDSHPISKNYKRERTHTEDFWKWLKEESKKPTEVYSPRKSARLNNAQGIIPNEVKSSRKPTLLKNRCQGRCENVDVTSARKSARLVSARPEISVDAALKQKPKSTEAKMPKSANVRRKLDLHNPRDEGEDIDGDENMDENDIEDEDLPPPPPLESSPVKLMTLTQYEMIKLLNIQRNNENLKELNLPTLVVDLTNQMEKDKRKIKGKRKVQDEDEYVQENEEQSDDGASEILPKDDMNEEATNSVLVEHPSETQLPCIQGIGSMADYLAMRELRQKKATEAVATGSGTKTNKVPETDLPDIENKEAEADPEVQARAEKNSRSHREYTDTQTAGPQLFSQIRHNMDTINKKLQSAEGLDGLDELVSDGKKSHGPAPTDSYIQELTKKLRQEVVEEVEAKLNQKVSEEVDVKVNQKVQDNLTLVLKKLVDANPSLNINIDEICATISSDTGGDGTPMTNGPSS